MAIKFIICGYVYLVKYRNIDQAHTKFMRVIVLRRERKNEARKTMEGFTFFLNLLFLKKIYNKMLVAKLIAEYMDLICCS